jgi:hypothetical protein
MIGAAVLGATNAADEMVGYLGHRQPLWQVETAGVDIEMTRRPTVAAVHLQQLPISDEVANRHGLEVEGLRLAAALGLVPILLNLDKLGQAGDQASDFLGLIIAQSERATACGGSPYT